MEEKNRLAYPQRTRSHDPPPPPSATPNRPPYPHHTHKTAAENEKNKKTHRQIRMLQRIPDLDPPLRAERETFLEEVDRLRHAKTEVSIRVGVGVTKKEKKKQEQKPETHRRTRPGEQRLQILLLPKRQRADIFPAPLARDRVEIIDRRRTEDVEDDRELVVVCEWGSVSAVVRRACGEGGRRKDSQSRPGNSGFPLSISASTHPTLQMSIARVYSLKVSITSGARYHLERRGTVSKANE